MVQQLMRGSRKLLSQPFDRTVRAKQAMLRTCSMLAGPDVSLSPAQQGIKAKKKVALHLGRCKLCPCLPLLPPHLQVTMSSRHFKFELGV